MRTAQEIINKRDEERKQAEEMRSKAEAEKMAKMPHILKELSESLITEGNKLVEEIYRSGRITYNETKWWGNSVGILPRDFDNITQEMYDKFIEDIARPFIEGGYEISVSLPWPDWSGDHPGKLAIGLPGSIKPEYRIELGKE